MTKIKRPICSSCHYPAKTCICTSVQPFVCHTQFDILQHPSEVKAAKNTARICKLCIPDINIWVGESEIDFLPLVESLNTGNAKIVLLYPSDESIEISTFLSKNDHNSFGRFRVLLIDGTWKKAYKIMQLNPWLKELTAIKLEDIKSSYDIRKSPSENALSTLEALAHTLKTIEPNIETRTLFSAFDDMQSHFKSNGTY